MFKTRVDLLMLLNFVAVRMENKGHNLLLLHQRMQSIGGRLEVEAQSQTTESLQRCPEWG